MAVAAALAALATLALLACHPGATASPPPAASSPTPAPTPAPTPTPTPAASATAHASASAPVGTATPAATPTSPPATVGLDGPGLDDAWTPALAARLTKAAEAAPPGQMQQPGPDPERDRAIQALFGPNCRLERTCGPLWGIDCDAAVDGPYYYARPHLEHVERITTCGGACMGGRCTKCPPRADGWTCATY
ncbi:MAG: hypothetical protein IT373_35240 [Polyangiaceae bacterium]|nr:hypothetical protein [Polyangiaceae bacterium]